MLGEPALALELVRSPFAGVGEEVDPLVGELGAKRLVGRKDPADRPVFLRNERLDLALALDHEPHRDALHAAGAEALGDFAPQQRRNLVADDAVEDAAGLLGVHPALVDGWGCLKAFLDLALGDRFEDDPLHPAVGMPSACWRCHGDRLTLTVQVGCR
jgi:hypothetical protein